jgi:putative ABC transport system substrate-binding protein
VRNAEAAGSSLGIEIVPTPVADAADIERGIEEFSRGPNGGLLLPSDGTTIVHRDLVIALAARHNLPAVYALRVFVTSGGLMSYSTELDEAFQQAASLVDHILRGAKPIDLPVQTPTKYQTSLNLKTAKALGLTVPSGLLVAADDRVSTTAHAPCCICSRPPLAQSGHSERLNRCPLSGVKRASVPC